MILQLSCGYILYKKNKYMLFVQHRVTIKQEIKKLKLNLQIIHKNQHKKNTNYYPAQSSGYAIN